MGNDEILDIPDFDNSDIDLGEYLDHHEIYDDSDY